MTWSGDISRMGQLAGTMRRLASVPSRAARPVADAIHDLIEEEFATGRDPYGHPWKALTARTLAKRSQVTEPPLTDYGVMRATLSVKPLPGAGVGITISHPAAPHQTGWSGTQGSGPARPILPTYGPPRAWNAAIKAIVDAEVRG